uniref:RING-type domain-containing protein n=1 Tax=Dendroctonus ponderosae TaxID=77166 RepID=A0AAR5PH82_DENPD
MRNLKVQIEKMANLRKKPCVKELNAYCTCKLCHGYFIDATTLIDCLHTFCRGCILRHFDNSKAQVQCPVCPALYKKKSQCFRSDMQMQALVYKVVPYLYYKEMQRREDFYRSTGVRAGSSCSDDSVIDRERDMMHEMEELVSHNVGDKTQYFNQDDLISLSLEYYQAHLDHTNVLNSKNSTKSESAENKPQLSNPENGLIKTTSNISVDTSSDLKCDSNQTSAKNNGKVSDNISTDSVPKECDIRYLRCPAGINMKHLQKFLRMKYGLTGDHRVDIIYKGEVLHSDFSLMDIAYTFQWEKIKPMRLFYRIFTPLKIRPIKIVNTASPTGEKQLQIVPVTSNNHITTNPRVEPLGDASKTPKVEENRVETIQVKQVLPAREESEREQQNKEILLANLQLQSKSKAVQKAETKKVQVPEKIVRECIFEYEEPDEEEIKRFAEKRDREWALQKKLEEETKADNDDFFLNKNAYPTKKRKKSKHSKNDSNGHKEKRRKTHSDKIHAEITNNDKSDLKLKVKITTNGYKHKHHKIESAAEQINKEKLLQMRQVRHKHMSGSSGDEKSQPAIPTIKLPKSHISERTKECKSGEPEPKRRKENPDTSEYTFSNSDSEIGIKPKLEGQPKAKVEPMIVKPVSSTVEPSSAGPSVSKAVLQSSGNPCKLAKKNSCLKSTQFDSADRQNQKTFLKSTVSNSDKYTKDQKIGQGKMESSKASGSMSNKVLPIGSITTNNKTLDRKIASLQQRCTIESKTPTKTVHFSSKSDTKISNESENSKIATAQYPPGFTVSKVESGTKRKAESTEQGKRPSLEITLIPPSTSSASKAAESKPMAKRPPPGTIPLERIKNAVNLKSGISIIPKKIDRTDNIGVLDLSKSGKSPENASRSSPKTEPINGLNSMVNRQIGNMIQKPVGLPNKATPENKNVQLSNLQMLSKVATEHPTLNKPTPNNPNKTKLQLPNLQTIGKFPSPNGARGPSLQRMLPKLNGIQKFRPSSPHIRNIRPNQNQNIRNIPNPSLLLSRNQNLSQNRVVSSAGVVSTSSIPERKVTTPKSSPVPVTSSTSASTTKELPSLKPTASEQNVPDIKEISV